MDSTHARKTEIAIGLRQRFDNILGAAALKQIPWEEAFARLADSKKQAAEEIAALDPENPLA